MIAYYMQNVNLKNDLDKNPSLPIFATRYVA